MSLLFRGSRGDSGAGSSLIPGRTSQSVGSVVVTPEQALRHSAVWAAQRLRADLISTMPLDVLRRVLTASGDLDVGVPTPPVLTNPGGPHWSRLDWLYASQVDLDRFGNAFGIITARDGAGLPYQIDLVPAADVTVLVRSGTVTYRVGSKVYERADIWHERQYPVAGMPVGLSPISHAAMAIGQAQSAQQFAIAWFGNGSGTHMPQAILRSTEKVLSPAQADVMKERFKNSIHAGDVFVTGKDWEFDPITAAANDAQFLATIDATAIDIARFFGVPADLIDAAIKGSSITYANITERNLQFLVMNLGPAIIRREAALSTLLSRPRFVKLNTDALLRMSPETRAKMLGQQIRDRIVTPDEARELENRPPLTEAQYAQFDRLFARATQPVTSTTPQGVSA